MPIRATPVDLKSLTPVELEAWLASLDEPRYRAQQIMAWIYDRGVHDPMEMTNLPKELRARLAELSMISHLEIQKVAVSEDGTRKYLLGLPDGESIESVLIPEAERRTLCISSQVGCGMACAFCATGLGGLTRNLRAGEIVDQVLTVQQEAGTRVTNVVFMGMGEPLANFDQVLKAVQLLNHPWGVGLGMRRITVSTCGIVPGIQRLAELKLQLTLAVSLHAATNEKRNLIMPINRKYPIEVLMPACREYVSKTGRRITFEYVLLEEINDTPEDADALGKLLHGLLCHVNLIPFNPVPETPFRRPSDQRIERFQERVRQYGVEATIRWERGADIEAACGQLRRRSEVMSR